MSKRPLRSPVAATAFAVAVALCLLTAPGASARDGDAAARSDVENLLVSREQRTATDRALAWIAAHQSPGGFWGEERGTRVADTALCTLALMAGGNTVTPGAALDGGGVGPVTLRGRYAKEVRNALSYLARLAWSDQPGKQAGYIANDAQSQMHGHGFAMLTLAEACGNLGPHNPATIDAFLASGRSASELSLADQVRYGLERAVRLAERAQDQETGGWSYTPTEGGHEGSMTVTQIVGLRAARDAGIPVNAVTMKRAYEYVRRSQNRTNPELMGGYAYELTHLDRVSYALTGAALSTLYGLGHYGGKPDDKEAIERGLAYMDRNFRDALDPSGQWYWYRMFYGAQTLYLSDDQRRIERQWPRMRSAILSLQHRDGSFRKLGPASEPGGEEYSTAMACLALQVPMETLPIFQRR